MAMKQQPTALNGCRICGAFHRFASDRGQALDSASLTHYPGAVTTIALNYATST
jgi:hypothetical protein